MKSKISGVIDTMFNFLGFSRENEKLRKENAHLTSTIDAMIGRQNELVAEYDRLDEESDRLENENIDLILENAKLDFRIETLWNEHLSMLHEMREKGFDV